MIISMIKNHSQDKHSKAAWLESGVWESCDSYISTVIVNGQWSKIDNVIQVGHNHPFNYTFPDHKLSVSLCPYLWTRRSEYVFQMKGLWSVRRMAVRVAEGVCVVKSCRSHINQHLKTQAHFHSGKQTERDSHWHNRQNESVKDTESDMEHFLFMKSKWKASQNRIEVDGSTYRTELVKGWKHDSVWKREECQTQRWNKWKHNTGRKHSTDRIQYKREVT